MIIYEDLPEAKRSSQKSWEAITLLLQELGNMEKETRMRSHVLSLTKYGIQFWHGKLKNYFWIY